MTTTKKAAPKKPQKKPAKKPPVKVDLKKNLMIEAMRKNLGIVSASCKMVGISRWTHYDWVKNDPNYAKEIEGISEDCIDFAEGQLLRKINSGDTIAILFYLKTKGKSRGFVEKSELGLTDKEGNDVKEQVIIIGGREIKF